MRQTIIGLKPAGVDNTFFIEPEGSGSLLATRTNYQDEGTIEYKGDLYLPWNPATSKLSSMLLKGMKIPAGRNSRVLYLGAASGTTVTHVSDIVSDGIVFAVEFAPRPARDLIKAVEKRENVIPIIADARYPDMYPPFIDHIDLLYQDVAQPEQAAIALANAEKYLLPGGHAVIAIKSRSISLSDDTDAIFKKEIGRLAEKMEICEAISLKPLHKDHMAVVCAQRTNRS